METKLTGFPEFLEADLTAASAAFRTFSSWADTLDHPPVMAFSLGWDLGLGSFWQPATPMRAKSAASLMEAFIP